MPELGTNLIADVGGTNARFALLPADGEPVEPHSFLVRDYPGLAEAASAYLDRVSPSVRPRAAMIAIAATPTEGRIRMANSGWEFALDAAREQLGLEQLSVINDFAAVGWAMLDLSPDRLVRIGSVSLGSRVGRFAAVGCGTGLGVGAVLRDTEGRMSVTATEGGHVDYAPVSDEEDAILLALRKRFGRVSYERLLSGPGLVNIFHCLAGSNRPIEPEAIVARAAASDPLAQRAVDHFCAVLGSFAGNVALMHGAWDGIFLSGGLLVSLKEALSGGAFRQRFDTKGRFSDKLARIPTMLALDTSLGLRGAAAALRAELGGAGMGLPPAPGWSSRRV